MLSIFLKIMAKETSLISMITLVNTLNNAIGRTNNLFVYVFYLVGTEKYTYLRKYFTVSSNIKLPNLISISQPDSKFSYAYKKICMALPQYFNNDIRNSLNLKLLV